MARAQRTDTAGRARTEVRLLLERWEQVKAGHGQVVLLTGDAGIGKCRLVQMLKDHVANEPHMRWECRSAEYYQNTALFPLTDLFQRLLQFQAEDTPDEKLGKLEQTLSQYRLPLEESVPLFAPLLSLPLPENRYPPLNLSPQRQRQKTLETIVAILLELAEHQPVLFILEDLHWTDPTTLELLNLLIEQIPTTSILTCADLSSAFSTCLASPFVSHRNHGQPLITAQVAQIVNRMTDGKTLPPEVLQQIVDKTDGVPLFVEEMTKAILESGHLKAVDGHYELTGSFSTFAIPATLARFAHGTSGSTGHRQSRCAICRSHWASICVCCCSKRSHNWTKPPCSVSWDRLVEAEIVYQRGVPPQATYVFKHALIQDAAYESLLKSTRQHYHQRIAQVLGSPVP